MSEEFLNLYASRNIIGLMKSKWVRWERRVAHMGWMRSAYKILAGKLKIREHSKYVCVVGRISE
jgi:hypothetical protein